MNDIINTALSCLNESSISDRFAERAAAIKKGNEYEARYLALLDKFKKTIPWTKKPTKSKSSALVEYTGEIGKNRLSFNFHEPDNKWGYSWFYIGALISPDKSKHEINEFGPKVDIIKIALIPTDKEYEQNLKDFQEAIDLAKKLK